jgi:hypothetical protein
LPEFSVFTTNETGIANLHLKELTLWNNDLDYYNDDYELIRPNLNLNVMEEMINSLCGEALLKLSSNIITPEIVRTVKESCPNINYLRIKVYSNQYLKSSIQLICELLSLKILNIKAIYTDDISDLLLKTLGDYLISVECLSLDFTMNISSFEYFVNNCKANLKKLAFRSRRRDSLQFLKCVDNFQEKHSSLKLLEIQNNLHKWTNEELKIIDSLKNQGVMIIHK